MFSSDQKKQDSSDASEDDPQIKMGADLENKILIEIDQDKTNKIARLLDRTAAKRQNSSRAVGRKKELKQMVKYMKKEG